MKTKTVKQTVTFDANPEEVYELIMDSKKHAGFTGAAAKISGKVGGKFSAYDGGLVGSNLELLPGKKIVQSWQCNMAYWPKSHFSTATFEFKKIGTKTKLTFTHTQVPDAAYASIKQGWIDHYWEPMKQYLKK